MIFQTIPTVLKIYFGVFFPIVSFTLNSILLILSKNRFCAISAVPNEALRMSRGDLSGILRVWRE